jgi:hypothetical protein
MGILEEYSIEQKKGAKNIYLRRRAFKYRTLMRDVSEQVNLIPKKKQRNKDYNEGRRYMMWIWFFIARRF